jgi:hypothetical protein
MILAAILGVSLFNLAPGSSFALRAEAGGSAELVASWDQASPAAVQTTQQGTQPATPSTAAPGQSGQASQPAKKASPGAQPAAKRRKRRSDCSTGTAGAGNKPVNSSQTPCPLPKVVVKDGGSNETAVQLKGTSNEQQERSTTEQITAATEDNLKKVAGRTLDTSQQQTLSQVKEFLEQSKTAIAEGDLERGHDLAMKARLLSDELVKP